jgi:hypothetical protein
MVLKLVVVLRCAVDDENKSPTRASRESYIQSGEVTMPPVTIDRLPIANPVARHHVGVGGDASGPPDVDDIRLICSASPPAMIFRDGASGCNGSEARDGEHAPRCDSDQARVRESSVEDRRCGTPKHVLDSLGITTLPMWSGQGPTSARVYAPPSRKIRTFDGAGDRCRGQDRGSAGDWMKRAVGTAKQGLGAGIG